MKNFAREAALAQVRIAIKILGRLHRGRSDAFALQQHHHLVRRIFCRPLTDPIIELLAIGHARRRLGKPMIRQPLAMTGDIAETHPLVLGLNGDNAPLIGAFAAIAAMSGAFGVFCGAMFSKYFLTRRSATSVLKSPTSATTALFGA